jgi:hypothetical protein
MSSAFISALKSEIAELEAQLAADIRMVRIRELRKIMELYGDNPGTTAGDVPSQPKGVGGRKPSPEKEQALETIRRLLSGKIVPTPTRDILANLQSEGISYPGESPLNNLSAALSNASEFVSHGRSGWTLADVEVRRLINDLAEKMPLNEGLELVSSWQAKRGIPQELDGKLLATARERLGRDLDERERAFLRESLIETLRQIYLVRVHEGSSP